MGGCEIYARVLTRSGEDDEDDGGETEKTSGFWTAFFRPRPRLPRGVFKKPKETVKRKGKAGFFFMKTYLGKESGRNIWLKKQQSAKAKGGGRIFEGQISLHPLSLLFSQVLSHMQLFLINGG